VKVLKVITTLLLWISAAAASGIVLVLAAAFLYLNPQIPATETFKNVKIRAPLRIYSNDSKLIQEFGERLTPVTFEQLPNLYIRALLDTEDKRFFEHSGIDLVTLVNATWQLISSGGSINTGASTITMQLVKNISGESQQQFIRKFKEMLLAIKIEREMSKQEILTLYLNIIPFGKHAFGVQAAANTYYGKNIDELTLAQLAMLAGIPKKPEGGNPINGPEWALDRRNLVLRRMLEQGSIERSTFDEAVASPITADVHQRPIELPSLYVAEMVRQTLLEQFGSDAYTLGLVAHTTIDSEMQRSAERALQTALEEYDRRHGYRGPDFRQIQGTSEFLSAPEYGYPDNWLNSLANAQTLGTQHPAIVTAVADQSIDVLTRDNATLTIPWEGLKWARPYIDVDTRGPSPKSAADIVAVGDLVRIEHMDAGWQLGQTPAIQGALVALAPENGAVTALVGGYDFNALQYNHASQAKRQPGSNFKPFFYAGALESGMTAATIYNDAPITLPGGDLEETYRPKNSSDEFRGNISLREALYRSINLVSLRVILDYGPDNAIEYVSRFGFDTSNFPRDVQLAFGGGTIQLTPLEIATGYASFANGGYKITPHLVTRVESINEDLLWQADPPTVCIADCADMNLAPRVMDARVAFIMNSILSDSIRKGTGTKAYRALKRSDLKGKTGTTNNADTWFSGFTTDLVATAWAGFSDNSSVGSREWGSTTPIETWISFMSEALPPEEESTPIQTPDGLVTVRIDRATGLRTAPGDPDGVFEFFREELVPAMSVASKQKQESQPVQEIF
jgi:penicillin-binding protein 1A